MNQYQLMLLAILLACFPFGIMTLSRVVGYMPERKTLMEKSPRKWSLQSNHEITCESKDVNHPD